MKNTPKGRPKKYSEYETVLKEHPKGSMKKRPVYVNGIGIFRGAKSDTVWIKIRLPKGATFKGKSYKPGASLEIKLGNLASFSWEGLENLHREYQGKADRGEPLEDQVPLTFQEFARDWLRHAEIRTKSKTNWYDVEKILIPHFGKMNISDISSTDIDRWQTSRLENVKPSTAKRNKNTLKAILNNAVKHNLILKNPCDNAYKIKGIQDYARYYTPEETLKICQAASSIDANGWFADFILFALYTGMRRGEILALEWKDIKTLPNGGQIIHIKTSKSDKGRTIPCTPDLVELLRRQSMRENSMLEVNWQKDETDTRVFPVSETTIKRRWKKAKEIADIKQGRLHDWRATNITYALLSGVDPKTLTTLTGHKDMQMIDKHYARVVENAASNAMNSIGNYISDALNEVENAPAKD